MNVHYLCNMTVHAHHLVEIIQTIYVHKPTIWYYHDNIFST